MEELVLNTFIEKFSEIKTYMDCVKGYEKRKLDAVKKIKSKDVSGHSEVVSELKDFNRYQQKSFLALTEMQKKIFHMVDFYNLLKGNGTAIPLTDEEQKIFDEAVRHKPQEPFIIENGEIIAFDKSLQPGIDKKIDEVDDNILSEIFKQIQKVNI